MKNKGIYAGWVKRPLDFLLSFFAIILLSPIIIVVAILVGIKLGTPIIFKQKRPGLNEKIFTMYKFRTMSNAVDEDGNPLPDHLRLTKFGKLLRSTSLDELPGLFNILKGDMAIIGPRPLLVSYLHLYNEKQKRRHEVRPGLSGWAQVNGRNAVSWEKKFELDIEYVDNVTLKKDVQIILLTLKKVFIREGIEFENATVSNKFTGSKEEMDGKKK